MCKQCPEDVEEQIAELVVEAKCYKLAKLEMLKRDADASER